MYCPWSCHGSEEPKGPAQGTSWETAHPAAPPISPSRPRHELWPGQARAHAPQTDDLRGLVSLNAETDRDHEPRHLTTGGALAMYVDPHGDLGHQGARRDRRHGDHHQERDEGEGSLTRRMRDEQIAVHAPQPSVEIWGVTDAPPLAPPG